MFGLLFGGTAVLILLLSPPIVGDIRTDGRAILVTFAGVLAGWPAAVVATTITAIARWGVGGSSWHLGVFELLLAGILGILLHRRRYLEGASPGILVYMLIGLVFSGINLSFAVTNYDVVFQDGRWIPLLTALSYYFIASIVIGALVSHERGRITLEQETTRTAERLESVLASVQVGVAILDNKGYVTEINETGAQIIGLPRDDITNIKVGASGWEYFKDDGSKMHSQDRPEIRMLRTREPFDNIELAFRSSPEVPLTWVMVNGTPVADGAIVTFYDITSLRDQRTFVESITSSSPDIIYIFDLTTQSNVYSNQNMLSSLGYDPKEIQEMGEAFLPSLLHPDDVKNVPDLLARWQFVEGDELLTHQYRMRHKDGTWHWFEARDRVYKRDENGTPIQIVGSARDVTVRLIAERDLAESERRLQAIMDNARNAIFMKDVEGRYLLVNNQYLKYAKLPKEDIIGRTDKELGLREFAESVMKNDQKVITTGEPLEEHWQAPEAIGGATFISHKFPLTNDAGEIYAMGGISTDITPLVEAEHALAESESRLRIALDAAEDAVWDWNAVTNETFASPRWYEVMGANGIQPTFAQIEERTHPDDWPAAYAELVKRFKGDDSPFQLECRIQKPDQSWHWVVVRGRVVARGDDGRVHRMLGTIRDITARKNAELALHRLSQAVDQSLDGVIVSDNEGHIQFCNQSAAKLFGRAHDELIGEPLDILHPHDIEEVVWRNVLDSGSNADVICLCTRPGESDFPARMSVSLLKSPEGEPHGLILIVHDRTSEEELEDQLRQAQKMEAIGRLAGGVAHDFNNILQAIQGYIECAIEELETGHPIQEVLRESTRATSQATSLVSQLLTFSRRETLNIVPVNLNTLIGDAVNLLRRLLGDDVDVRIDIRPSIPNILADAIQFEQILINLCVNARDAMPNGGSITIATGERTFTPLDLATSPWAQTGKFVTLMVEDTGVGISEDLQKRVYEPFFTTKATGHGTGLGLASVYATVTRHKGFIRLESAPGEGTRFTLYLPVSAKSGSVAITDSREDTVEQTQGNGVILIAEDNDQVRVLAERVLGRAGYTIHAACDGEEAIQLAEQLGDSVSVALLDVVMPRKNGRAVYEFIRQQGHTYPVIFSSGYSFDVLDANQLPEGDFDLLQKPYAIADLVQRVHHTLQDHRETRHH